MRIFISSFILFCLPINLLGQTEIPGNSYSPAGKWIVFDAAAEGFGQTKLFVPSFVTDANAFVLKKVGYQLLRFSRRQVYSELFKELLLQTTSQDLNFEYGVSKPISVAVETAGGEIKILNELSVATKSGLVYKNLPGQLEAVSMVFAVDSKVTKAAGDAISAYTTLSTFTESRNQLLLNMISNLSYIDPELKKGLSDAYIEIQRMKEKDMDTFKNQAQNSAFVSGTMEEITKSILKTQFGNLVSTIIAGGVEGTSLGVALPAAWFYQLSRGFESDQAEACIVLLSTLDRLVFENPYFGSSATNKYLFLQLRSHLSFMIRLAAIEYFNKVSSLSKDKQPIQAWLRDFPYYDEAELSFIKQNAIRDIKITGQVTESLKANTETGTFTDERDGHTYKWVKIGSQIWMAENIAATNYCNGDAIPFVSDFDTWETTIKGMYCYYDLNKSNRSTYGLLYNWYAVIDDSKLCPLGWHVPSDKEWQVLIDFLGGNDLAGNKMKETISKYWINLKQNSDNSSNFSALPGGSYSTFTRKSDGLGEVGCWWSCTSVSQEIAYDFWLIDEESFISPTRRNKHIGNSVRCLKNVETSKISSHNIEEQIRQFLYKERRIGQNDELSFKISDLNKDGINEFAVTDLSLSGTGWGLHFLLKTEPIAILFDMEGVVSYEILESSTNGYKDLVTYNREPGKTIYKPSTVKWNGNSYQAIE